MRPRSRVSRWALAVVSLGLCASRWALAVVSLGLCACGGRNTALDPAGPQADRLRDLWWVFFAVAVVVSVLVFGAAAAAVVRSRRRASEDDTPLPRSEPHERRLARVVGAFALVTVLTLFGLLVASIDTGRAIAALPPEGALPVKVVGHQWWWEVHYPDALPSNEVITANEIHVPVGRVIELELSSRDVIHSFWVPRLHGKRDLIPGERNKLLVRVDQPGVYRGQCAEFCGYQHAHMAIVVVAEPPEVFARWLDAQRAPAEPPTDPLRQRGLATFMSSACATCHNIGGTDAYGSIGPDLTHVGSRHTLAAGTLENQPRHLERWIADTQGAKPGALMPRVPLYPDDRQALVAYLEGLR